MVWEGQNVGLYGLGENPAADCSPDYTAAGEVRDNDGYGFVASIGFAVNDCMGVEAGYGYVKFEDDVEGSKSKDNACAVYLQAPITLAQGVSVVPEIGYYDYKANSAKADQGHETYFGAKWQMNF